MMLSSSALLTSREELHWLTMEKGCSLPKKKEKGRERVCEEEVIIVEYCTRTLLIYYWHLCLSMIYEAKDDFLNDLTLVDVLIVTACNAIAIWSLAPCRSYGNTFHFNLQNTLQKLPNNTFEKSCAIARAILVWQSLKLKLCPSSRTNALGYGLDYHLKLAFKRFDNFFALKNGSRALIDFIVEDLRSMFGISSQAELYFLLPFTVTKLYKKTY
ncbi:hypothetical protein F8388_023127 [Cannabis sativa]|uniref:Uncharacterized protein n=1 Tax=Cannabis sativa TaxID=3483 RepID=A0A7J6FMA5_CANSA|nr:hypothetical protein F8388_023127 [Cannabis sativa]